MQSQRQALIYATLYKELEHPRVLVPAGGAGTNPPQIPGTTKFWGSKTIIHTKEKEKQTTIHTALAGVAQWVERGLQTSGSLVRFPVRAYA